MTAGPKETYDWFDDETALKTSAETPVGLPGIPESLRNAGWWMAGLAFSVLWMIESWTSAAPGESGVGEVSEGVWRLLLALGICYGIFKFLKDQSRPLAHLLCGVSAVVLLLSHIVGH